MRWLLVTLWAHSKKHANLSRMHVPSHLEKLEAESIFIMHELAAQFERPVLRYSAGKTYSERTTRIINFDTDGSMQLKKRRGFF